ncbi:MAG: redoxin domain-containing protein [Candidatus Hydrogenedentes bacterium]|nr:redoxin domain-containing protein [Candidatus Hydrogenedentota bacterium]
MQYSGITLKALSLVLLLALPVWGGEATAGEKAIDFRLIDHRGASHQIHRFLDKKFIVLTAWQHDCPDTAAISAAIDELAALDVAAIAALGVSPSPLAAHDAVTQKAAALGIHAPILLDEAQLIVPQLGLEYAGDTLLVEAGSWKVLQRGTAASAEGVQALRAALESCLKGEGIPVSAAPAGEGACVLDVAPQLQDVSYSKDIAPILAAHCVACHSPGNGAPFSFSDAKKAQGWAKMTKEVVLTQRMPPWSADPHIGVFKNGRGLSPEEQRKLAAWIDAGAVVGAGESDPLSKLELPAPRAWLLGAPDLVLAFEKPEVIPPEGVQKYRHIFVKSNLTEDKWLRGADVLPGNAAVVHHVLVFMKYPEDKDWMQYDPVDGMRSFTAGFVQGKEVAFFPEGTGMFVPAGTEFMFQMHYTATGKEETDVSELGLYFCKEKPERELMMRTAFHINFAIPPHATDYEISAKHLVKQDSMLYSMTPHMHFRGSRMRYDAHFPDGTSKTLLSVVNYDFNWQHLYELAEPVFLPQGTKIECVGAFDNSVRNEFNPNPDDTVEFGQQSWEEMYIGYIAYAPVAPIKDGPHRRY